MEKMVVRNEEFFGKVVALLAEGKQVTIPVKGFSMLPFIRGEKDLVVLEKPGELRRGDIVLFRIGNRYIMHRILEVKGDGLEIMGDGVLANREHVTRDDVCGRAVSILRNGRRAVDPDSPRQRRRAETWRKLLPVRRWLLAFSRLLPWNSVWLYPQYRQAREDMNKLSIN